MWLQLDKNLRVEIGMFQRLASRDSIDWVVMKTLLKQVD